ncbi:MAG: trehalose-phosphatase [Spirochaetia bacterium]|nr:trehalose-phosphatase [Spirochaetia bacterium]
MKNVLEALPSLLSKENGRGIAVFFDFDGTLAPITKTPEMAEMPEITRRLLRRMLAVKGITIAIISGRSLADLKKKVGIDGIIYSGSHGSEIEGPDIRYSRYSGGGRRRIAAAKAYLKKKLDGINGVIFEDKGSSLAVHYRMADRTGAEAARSAVEQYLKNRLIHGTLELKKGKKVCEIVLPGMMHKGDAVRWIMKRKGLDKGLVFYLGDDITDRDAFKELKGKGTAVYIGHKTSARYVSFYLKNIYETAIFIDMIIEYRRRQNE